MKKIILSLLFISSISFAQNGINYQGAATDADGAKLVNQNISLKTSVLQGGVDGTTSYSETHNTTTDQFGLFNVVIGLGNIIEGSFDSIQWGADSHFLKVELDATGGTNYSLVSTTQMMSVPYSLYSKSTDLDSIKSFLENDEDFNSKFNKNDVLNDISEFDNNSRGIKYLNNNDSYVSNYPNLIQNRWRSEKNSLFYLGNYNSGVDHSYWGSEFMEQPLLENSNNWSTDYSGIFCAKVDTNFNYVGSYSEVIDEQWDKMYVIDVKVDDQDNIYLLYYKQGITDYYYNLILKKFNSNFNLISTLLVAENVYETNSSTHVNNTMIDIHDNNLVIVFTFQYGTDVLVNDNSITSDAGHNWLILKVNTNMSIEWHNHFSDDDYVSYNESKLKVYDNIYLTNRIESTTSGDVLHKFDLNTGQLISTIQFDFSFQSKEILFDNNEIFAFLPFSNTSEEYFNQFPFYNVWGKGIMKVNENSISPLNYIGISNYYYSNLIEYDEKILISPKSDLIVLNEQYLVGDNQSAHLLFFDKTTGENTDLFTFKTTTPNETTFRGFKYIMQTENHIFLEFDSTNSTIIVNGTPFTNTRNGNLIRINK